MYEFFLKGLPTFTVATNHRPLVGTFNKNLADLTNPRLQRLREKVAAYCFKVIYVPAKTHNIADALSRAPIFPGTDELDIQIDIPCSNKQPCTRHSPQINQPRLSAVHGRYHQAHRDIKTVTTA